MGSEMCIRDRVLEVDAALMALMASLGGVDTLVLKGSTLPPFDFHCPLMSLPLAMGTDIGTVPAPSAYLQAAPDRLAKWRQRLGPRSTGGVSAWFAAVIRSTVMTITVPFP